MSRDMISSFLKNPFFLTKVNFLEKGALDCIIQPASGADLQKLPEGERYYPTVKIFSKVELANGDLFVHQGFRYRVISLSIWVDYGYYDTLATRYEGSASADSEGFVIR